MQLVEKCLRDVIKFPLPCYQPSYRIQDRLKCTEADSVDLKKYTVALVQVLNSTKTLVRALVASVFVEFIVNDLRTDRI